MHTNVTLRNYSSFSTFCHWPIFIHSLMVSSESNNIPMPGLLHRNRTLSSIRPLRSFKVILIGAGRNPERFRCNVQFAPALLLKLSKIYEREICKFVDFKRFQRPYSGLMTLLQVRKIASTKTEFYTK